MRYDVQDESLNLGLSSYLVVQVGRGVLIGSVYAEANGSEVFSARVADEARGVVQAMGALP